MIYKRIGVADAKRLLENESTVIVDIRDTFSFIYGHVNKAINLTQANLENFVKNTDKQQPLLVVCYHGNSSQVAAEYLSQQGFADVYSLDGGYEAWRTENV